MAQGQALQLRKQMVFIALLILIQFLSNLSLSNS